MEYNVIFNDKTFDNMKGEETGFYYAYDYILKGLRVFCGTFGIEPKWHDGYDEIVDWLKDNKGKGILVYGDKGTGKSLLCTRIIPKIIESKPESHGRNERCRKVAVYDAYDLAHTATEDLSLSYGFVCIDDVGVEEDYNQFGTRRSIFREIVNYAEQHGTTLILTSNLTIEQLKEKYGSRTVDRLRALVKPVVIRGASMRNGDKGDGYTIPEKHRAYGIDFQTKEEAEEFAQEQQVLRDYLSYTEKATVCRGDWEEWSEHLPFRIWNHVAYCIQKHEDMWEEVDWENDPDRTEYLKADFYE